MNHLTWHVLAGRRQLAVVSQVLITDDQQRVLLCWRGNERTWGLPGGCVEPGDSTEQTLGTQVLYQTGLMVREATLSGVFSGPELVHEYPGGDQVYYVCVVYRATDVVAQEWAGERSPNLCYFSLEDLPIDLDPSSRPVLKKFEETLVERAQADAMFLSL